MTSSILNRRSIRKYTKQEVSKEQIKEVLIAAMAAPSARNKKPWHFVVINERSVLDKIPDYHPYAKMIYEALLAILVCGNLRLDENLAYLAQNCSAATQNILLRATELGLGSVWLGVYPRETKPPHEGLDWGNVSFNYFKES